MNFDNLVQTLLEKFDLEKKRGLRGWFARNRGKG